MQGLLLLDKPEGITSYGAVARVKRLFGEKRVGHTGTLDPMATGVLPVLLGRATALSSCLLDADKRYTARVRLGVETDSCDLTGTVLNQRPVSVTPEQLATVLDRFTGALRQQPPMFSALKKDGVRLYELARRGETADIPFRDITVYSLTLTSPLDAAGEFEIETRVSKGTYIRSLARDIGRALGCGAALVSLRRTETAGFGLSCCVPLDTLTPENAAAYLLSEEAAVAHLRAVQVTGRQAVRFCNGGALELARLPVSHAEDGELFRVAHGGLFLGLGRYDAAEKSLSVKCVLRGREELL